MGNAFMKDFSGIEPFEKKLWLASPTTHGLELEYINDAIKKNWLTTEGDNVKAIEADITKYMRCKYAIALSCGTAALHLAVKLAGEAVYGKPPVGKGTLAGRKIFCSDMTFDASVNPVAYENGEAIFIDTEYDTWNMDPQALEKAFEIYPDVKIVIMAHLYGTPGKLDEIKDICDRHNAILIEDAAESLGSTYNGVQTGTIGKYNCISFNGNKIITGSAGGMLITNDKLATEKVKKWSTQSREAAPWYQHEEIGYNYRMSNLVAGTVRGQIPYLEEHIAQKKAIYERYREGFRDLPVSMNPYDNEKSVPNFWLSCLLIDRKAMCKQVRSDNEAIYISEHGKSCPTEILENLKKFNAEGRPIWKPMHLQPIYRVNPFIVKDGNGRARSNAYLDGNVNDVGADIFSRGLCLPSDNKMTVDQQEKVIKIVRRCFD